jgi:uncharacterized protein YndB with AHSA1/START domain
MTKIAAATRSLVVERVVPHPPEKTWGVLTRGPLIEEWLMIFNLVSSGPDNWLMARIIRAWNH